MNTTNYISIGGRQEVKPEEVLMLQAEINYTLVYFVNGRKTIVATPLKKLEERFTPFEFYRTHKSYLVNLKCVKCFIEPTNTLQMSGNQKVTVSRRKRLKLKEYLKDR